MIALHILWDRNELTPDRFGRLVRTFFQHSNYLRAISPYVDRDAKGNHFIMEMEGLLFGALLPWLKESDAWKRFSHTQLLRCLRTQILSDGVHVECAPAYHLGCMEWLAVPLVLAQLNGNSIPTWARQKLKSMFAFSMHMSMPNGQAFKIADCSNSNGGWQSVHLMASLFNCQFPSQLKKTSGFHVLIRNLKPLGRASKRRVPLARYYRSGGYAASRTSWDGDASALIFKLGGFGGGHSHADFLGLWYVLNGRLLIDEKGTWSYNNDSESVDCKRASAHSVLLLGNREMLEFRNPNRYFDAQCKPIVELRDTVARNGAKGQMRARGTVSWNDGAYWERRVDFDPRGQFDIRDSVQTTSKPENVRIQYYLRSSNVVKLGENSVETRDKGVPNARFECLGSSRPQVEIQTVIVHDRFFNQVQAQLVSFCMTGVVEGSWVTSITPLV